MPEVFRSDIDGVQMKPSDSKLTEWTSDPPIAPGLYLWSEPKGRITSLCHVVDRGRDVMIVKGHPKPVSEYDGYWIGPIGDDGCHIFTERSSRHRIKE